MSGKEFFATQRNAHMLHEFLDALKTDQTDLVAVGTTNARSVF